MDTDPMINLVNPKAKRSFKLPNWPGPAKYVITGLLVLELIGILITKGFPSGVYSSIVLACILATYGYDWLARHRLKHARELAHPSYGDRYRLYGKGAFAWVTKIDDEGVTYHSGWFDKPTTSMLGNFTQYYEYDPAPFIWLSKAQQWVLGWLPAGYDTARWLLLGSRLAAALILWITIGPWSLAMSAAFILAIIPREWLGYEDASNLDLLRGISEFLIVTAGLISAVLTFGAWGFLIIVAFAIGYLLIGS